MTACREILETQSRCAMHHIGGNLAQYSGTSDIRQGDFGVTDIFRDRLRAERLRVSSRQGDFAQKIGVGQSTYSEWETKAVSLRFDQLGLLADAGIDLGYIFSGQRSSQNLDVRESEMVQRFRRMPAKSQALILDLAFELARQDGSVAPNIQEGRDATLHSDKRSYRAPDEE